MRMNFRDALKSILVLCLAASWAVAQDNPERPRRGGFGGPIELGPDDVAFYDAPPEDFKTARENSLETQPLKQIMPSLWAAISSLSIRGLK